MTIKRRTWQLLLLCQFSWLTNFYFISVYNFDPTILANNNSPQPQAVPITVSRIGLKPYTDKDTLLKK